MGTLLSADSLIALKDRRSGRPSRRGIGGRTWRRRTWRRRTWRRRTWRWRSGRWRQIAFLLGSRAPQHLLLAEGVLVIRAIAQASDQNAAAALARSIHQVGQFQFARLQSFQPRCQTVTVIDRIMSRIDQERTDPVARRAAGQKHCNKRANHADGRRFPASATDQYASAVTPDHRPIQRIIAARAPSNGCLVPHGIRYPASCAEIRRHRRARLWQDARGLCLEPTKQRGKERRVRPQTLFYHVY